MTRAVPVILDSDASSVAPAYSSSHGQARPIPNHLERPHRLSFPLRLALIATRTPKAPRRLCARRRRIVYVFPIDILRARDEGCALLASSVALLEAVDFVFCTELVDETHRNWWVV